MKRTLVVPQKIEVVLGPAMIALPERYRLFCIAFMSNGGNGAEAARTAGYSDTGGGARVRASELIRDRRIQAALKELGDAAFVEMAPAALETIRKIRDNPQHPKQFDAAKYALTQAGYREVREINHNVTVTNEEKVERIKLLAAKLGRDPKEFLGENAIDVEFEDITDDEPVVVDGEEY